MTFTLIITSFFFRCPYIRRFPDSVETDTDILEAVLSALRPFSFYSETKN